MGYVNTILDSFNHNNKEARWHIGMLSASHREDPGSNLGKGLFFRLFSCRNGNENECRVLIKRKETT